jgi:hypothetical protein
VKWPLGVPVVLGVTCMLAAWWRGRRRDRGYKSTS